MLVGEYLGNKGSFEGKFIKATYLDVQLPANQEWFFTNGPENTLFAYIFAGKAIFGPDKSTDNPKDLIKEKQAVLFGQGEKFWIKAEDQVMRFILLSAKPLGKPIAWGGTIVMNTKEELNLAFSELVTILL